MINFLHYMAKQIKNSFFLDLDFIFARKAVKISTITNHAIGLSLWFLCQAFRNAVRQPLLPYWQY